MGSFGIFNEFLMKPLPPNLLRTAASILLVLKASFKSFSANRNLEIAATLAFYGFLSLMPLLLLTLVITGATLRTAQAGPALIAVLTGFFPGFNPDLLNDLTAIAGGGTLGMVSLALLIWAMTPLSGALRTALARMFNMPIHRPFLKSKLLDLLAVLCFIFLFCLLIALRILLPEPTHDVGLLFHLVVWLGTTALPFAISVAAIGLFFRVFSPVRLTWRQWLLGSVCVIVLWGVMRHLFVSFITYNPNYGYAFGSLKAIFLLVVWVYYAFATLLFGAEVMANTFRRDALFLRGLLDSAGAHPTTRGSLMQKFERTLSEGEILFREGDEGREMFVVLDGRIRLTHDDHELAVMDRGRYFGEMSLLTHAPRSATATALDPTRLAAVTQHNFDLLVRENPVLVRRILEELANRLIATNLKLER
jgi:membrane protein